MKRFITMLLLLAAQSLAAQEYNPLPKPEIRIEGEGSDQSIAMNAG